MALSPRSLTAIATSAHEIRSPVESIMSSSRGCGEGDTSRASARSVSVVLPIAETVATTRRPRRRASTMRRATVRTLSGSATDEPPNFITTVSNAAVTARAPRAGTARAPVGSGFRVGASGRARARAPARRAGDDPPRRRARHPGCRRPPVRPSGSSPRPRREAAAGSRSPSAPSPSGGAPRPSGRGGPSR